ncbi:MAG TPA: hypothetical protein VI731_12355 [Bacteroidia bacterium]|nr:hypothetical protein [Bacteroidia bacterium]
MRISRIAKWIFDFYLFGNFHIGLCTLALAFVTGIYFGIALPQKLVLFLFCGSIFGYNIQRLPAAFSHPEIKRHLLRHQFNTANRALLSVMTLVFAGIAIWAFAGLNGETRLLALVPAALSFGYAFPVLPTPKGFIQLRQIPGTKIFIIAITWTITCALLPVVAAKGQNENWLDLPVLLWADVFFFMLIAITIPFDIRDYSSDEKNLKTFPVILGIKKSIFIALVCLVISTLLLLFLYLKFRTGSFEFVLIWLIWCFIAGAGIAKSKPERHEYYYSFFLDGLMIVLWGMIMLAETLS